MHLAFSSLACPEWTVEQIADAAKRFGYGGIEWRLADGELLGPRTDDAVWERIASCGVPAVCLDTSAAFVQPTDELRAKAVRHTVRMAQRAVQIGAPCVRVFGGAIPEGGGRDDVIGPAREALGDAASSATGIAVLVETHDAWSAGRDIAPLVAGLDGVGVVWDVAHTLRAGEAPSTTLDLLGVPALVHVKDAVGERLAQLGDGDLALRDALQALDAASYDGWISFEWEKLWHPYLDDADVALPNAAAFLRA